MDLSNLDYIFYFFSVMLIGSALLVVSSRNPVYSVFFLILAFFTAAALFVLLGAEYLAMTLVIVYVGAVAVLFLFVVMMLNINFEQLRSGFQHYLPLGLTIAFLLCVELVSLFYISFLVSSDKAPPASPIPPADQVTNTLAIGRVLYTNYLLLFETAGLILLVAMIGAIVLTLRTRPGVKRQKIAKQNARTREESVVLMDIKSGEGI